MDWILVALVAAWFAWAVLRKKKHGCCGGGCSGCDGTKCSGGCNCH